MNRFTEKLNDGRNILRNGITDIFKIGFGRFFDGEAIDKLAEYEDLEEQGLLLKLPCKVGDTVYELCKCDDGTFLIFPMTVKSVAPYGSPILSKDKMCTVWNLYAESDYTKMYKSFYDFGKTIFLTNEEAEAALEKRIN